MSPALTIALLWLAFAVSHIALSSLRLVAVLGNRGFMGVYSLIALATFVPMVRVYFGNKHAGPMLWSFAMTPALEALATVVMAVAVLIMVAGAIAPSSPSRLGACTTSRDTRCSWQSGCSVWCIGFPTGSRAISRSSRAFRSSR